MAEESRLARLEDELQNVKTTSRKIFDRKLFNIAALEKDERKELDATTIDSSEALFPFFFESLDPGILGFLNGTDEAASGSSQV